MSETNTMENIHEWATLIETGNFYPILCSSCSSCEGSIWDIGGGLLFVCQGCKTATICPTELAERIGRPCMGEEAEYHTVVAYAYQDTVDGGDGGE